MKTYSHISHYHVWQLRLEIFWESDDLHFRFITFPLPRYQTEFNPCSPKSILHSMAYTLAQIVASLLLVSEARDLYAERCDPVNCREVPSNWYKRGHVHLTEEKNWGNHKQKPNPKWWYKWKAPQKARTDCQHEENIRICGRKYDKDHNSNNKDLVFSV